MATPPRISPPGSIHSITRRTLEGRFFFRPDIHTAQNFYYLLGVNQQRYGIEVHTGCLMPNHLHLLITDVRGDQLQSFNNDFFSLLARSTNADLGRSDSVLDHRKPNCVHVAPRAEDIARVSSYIIGNMVTAGLVETAKKWPGARILPREMGRLEIEVPRPKIFYDEFGDLPASVIFRATLPSVWDASSEELRTMISEQVNRLQGEVHRKLRDEGRKFLGVKAVKRRSVNARPRMPREMFELVPHVACRNQKLRKRMLEWRKWRNQRYEELRQLLLAGVQGLVFPEGTWALHFRGGQQRDPWRGCIWRRLAEEP